MRDNRIQPTMIMIEISIIIDWLLCYRCCSTTTATATATATATTDIVVVAAVTLNKIHRTKDGTQKKQ